MGAHLISERWPKKRQGVEEHARTVWQWPERDVLLCHIQRERSVVCVSVRVCASAAAANQMRNFSGYFV